MWPRIFPDGNLLQDRIGDYQAHGVQKLSNWIVPVTAKQGRFCKILLIIFKRIILKQLLRKRFGIVIEERKRIDPIAWLHFASVSQNGKHLDNTTI
jgi:hypothetical protein